MTGMGLSRCALGCMLVCVPPTTSRETPLTKLTISWRATPAEQVLQDMWHARYVILTASISGHLAAATLIRRPSLRSKECNSKGTISRPEIACTVYENAARQGAICASALGRRLWRIRTASIMDEPLLTLEKLVSSSRADRSGHECKTTRVPGRPNWLAACLTLEPESAIAKGLLQLGVADQGSHWAKLYLTPSGSSPCQQSNNYSDELSSP